MCLCFFLYFFSRHILETDAFYILLQGNAILCGLRNGVIVTVDAREKRAGSSARLIRHRITHAPLDKTVGNSTRQLFKV
jgi:hypothetical protein